jgi:hypothetical protein
MSISRLLLLASMGACLVLSQGCGSGSGTASPAQSGQCNELRPGQTTQVDHAATGLRARYRLARLSDHDGHPVYEIGLNLRFSAQAGYGGLDLPAMRRRTASCYEVFNPFMKSRDGTEFRLKLLEPGAEADATPEIPISVGSYVHRPFAQAWSAEQDCSITVHESLHHVGLVDEYRESLSTNTSGQALYDCRPQGPTRSVMSDSWSLYDFTGEFTVNLCTCDPQNPDIEACREELKKLHGTPSACPPHSRHEGGGMFPGYFFGVGDANQQGRHRRTLGGSLEERDRYEYIEYTPSRPELSPILPAHARLIIYPGCADRNQLYYTCVMNSYRTTRSRGGEGCVSAPSACSGEKHDWLLN